MIPNWDEKENTFFSDKRHARSLFTKFETIIQYLEFFNEQPLVRQLAKTMIAKKIRIIQEKILDTSPIYKEKVNTYMKRIAELVTIFKEKEVCENFIDYEDMMIQKYQEDISGIWVKHSDIKYCDFIRK